MVRIYLDHAATTPMAPEVLAAMQPYLTYRFGNPSSAHWFGREARTAIDDARDEIADAIGASRDEIYFTSGGTESDNLAIIGSTLAEKDGQNHIITTNVEHMAVIEPFEYLKSQGFDVTYLPVDSDGLVDPNHLRRAITNRTILISIIFGNNEIGTISPIAEIGDIAREYGVPFHTDAVQAFGSLPIDVNRLKVDMLSLTAHKIYGPKGAGALYVRAGTRVKPLLHGGSQERERRPGTENVAGIVGLAAASSLARTHMSDGMEQMTKLRDSLISQVMDKVADVRLNGHPTDRLPNNINLSFAGLDSESLLLNLDMEGIAASGGAACSAGALEPSHVLKALHMPQEYINGAIRLTLGRGTTEEDISYTVDALQKIVSRLRG